MMVCLRVLRIVVTFIDVVSYHYGWHHTSVTVTAARSTRITTDDKGENDRGLTTSDTKTRSLNQDTACQIEFRLLHITRLGHMLV
jgi:hypothetical protein